MLHVSFNFEKKLFVLDVFCGSLPTTYCECCTAEVWIIGRWVAVLMGAIERGRAALAPAVAPPLASYSSLDLVAYCRNCHWVHSSFAAHMDLHSSENGGDDGDLLSGHGTLQGFPQQIGPAVQTQLEVPQFDVGVGRAVGADAGRSVVQMLAGNIKMPWENNPVINSKRAFSMFQPKLEPMSVGLKDFIHGSMNEQVASSSTTSMAFSRNQEGEVGSVCGEPR